MTNDFDMRRYYNDFLKKEDLSYEQKRWFSSDEKEKAYNMTFDSISNFVVPLLFNGINVLEVGAGPGVWTKVFLEKISKINIDVVDISDEMLNQARKNLSKYKNISYVRSDFKLFKARKKYDLFFSSRAIEYMPSIDLVVKNISESIRPGGYGCIITKYPHYLRSKIIGRKIRKIHKTQIHPNKLIKLLKKNSFSIEHKVPVTFVFPMLHSGFLDMLMYKIFSNFPLEISQPLCESYMVVFKKNDN